MPHAWESIKKNFHLPPIIHLVGTNGKGSTGRFLAHYLYKNGFSIGHYSSPHILEFNERIWLNGANVESKELFFYHDRLYALLSKEYRESLSFFEYTTLLAICIYEECDYIILEAGLGGEYDATAVFSNILTLVTPIDIDHVEFLGDSIDKIAHTKLNAIQKIAILAPQKYEEVYRIAEELKDIEVLDSEDCFMPERVQEIEDFLIDKELPLFLKSNLTLALCAVKFLGLSISLEYLKDIVLFGRCQRILPNVTIDVGHNALAATALVQTFIERKIHLIFNSFADKDYEKTLTILKPAIQVIEIIPIFNERIEKKENLIKVIEKLDIPYKDFKELEETKEYLVFGSFVVVEAFLNKYAKTRKSEIPT